jgi:hypothetical protein
MKEEKYFMYEDKFVLIFKRMLEQAWNDENERLKEEKNASRKKKEIKKKWKKL